jgi:hypothetical protein
MKIKKVKDIPPDKRHKSESFMLDGYHIKNIDEKYHCNGFIFTKYNDLKFAVNYFNKRFIK